MRLVVTLFFCVLVGCSHSIQDGDALSDSGLNMDVVQPVAVVVASLIAIGLLASIATCDGDC